MIAISRNRIVKTTRDGALVIVKQYDDIERFSCERMHHAYFSEQGFHIPKILDISLNRKEIMFEFVEGKVLEGMNKNQLHSCTEVLARIFCTYTPRNAKESAKNYIHSFMRGIQTLDKGFIERIDNNALQYYISLLQTHFYVTLFKDAKASNWIFTNTGTVMIDFDYIRESFFLADLAQLVQYQMPCLDWEEALADYMELTSLNHKIQSATSQALFKVAAINSALAAIRHNPNMDESLKREFRRMSKLRLLDLGIVHP